MLKKANGKTVYVGDPTVLDWKAIAVPQVYFRYNEIALTLAALLQASYAKNENRPYFGTLGQIGQRTWRNERTIARHLAACCRILGPDGKPLIVKRGRQKRRTVTYQASDSLRNGFNDMRLAGSKFLRLPQVGLEHLTTWNARLLFAWLAFRWLLPARNPDRFGGEYDSSEAIDDENAAYEFAKFQITRTAKRLSLSRQGVYDAIEDILEARLAEIQKPDGDNYHRFTLHVALPPGKSRTHIEKYIIR